MITFKLVEIYIWNKACLCSFWLNYQWLFFVKCIKPIKQIIIILNICEFQLITWLKKSWYTIGIKIIDTNKEDKYLVPSRRF